MTPERWHRVEEVYHAVAAQADRERPELIGRLCGGDKDLEQEVESLLAHLSAASAFLESPVPLGDLAGEQELRDRRFGTFVVGELLGVGSMGEVYRAHDTQLERDVALKILRRPFWNDQDRRDRFEREARILAALNHPNIGAIYGHADVDGSPALVLELVDGETLAERMTRPLVLSETLTIARAIAEALEAAHERGVIHRDLKPANIKITPDGVVKVLDFGLAKLTAEEPHAVAEQTSHSSPLGAVEEGTRDGALLGTPAYMSPEQAVGRAADKRSDLWAFGVLLLEMLTGRPLVTVQSGADVLTSVLEVEPDFGRLPAATPNAIRTLLRRCLEKDRKRRLDSASAARWEIEDALAASRQPAASSGLNVPLVTALIVIAALLAFVASTQMSSVRRMSDAVSRFAIVTPPAQPLNVSSNDRDLAMSPDGRYLVYRAAGSTTNGSALFLRAIDQLEARQIGDFDTAYTPFFSPDSRWVAFFERAELKKVSITGGTAITLARVIGGPLGGSWGDDNMIVFATDDPQTGLWRVSADGGKPVELTTPEAGQRESDHAFPAMLPDGRGVLFTITAGQPRNAQVAWLDQKTGERRSLVRGGSQAEYVGGAAGLGQGGHLIFAAAGTLRAVRFDPVRRDLLGNPAVVVDRLMTKPNGAANYTVSSTGTLVYVPEGAAAATPMTVLTWVDRSGREKPIDAPPRAYGPPRVSPDGTRVAVGFPDQGDTEIWILDLARAVQRRLTFSPGMDGLPLWRPDGRGIVFMSARSGALNWYGIATDGGGGAERLTTSPTPQWPVSIAPKGDRVFGFEIATASTRRVIAATLDPASGRALTTPQRAQDLFPGVFPEISPNGRYIAYQSQESGGRDEVYVRSFPAVDQGRWQISTGGGTRPAWSRKGTELFYLDDSNTMRAVPVDTSGPALVAGTPAKLFDAKFAQPNPARHYDVSPDGRWFLVLKPRAADANATPAHMIAVARWFDELKARVP